MSTGSFKHDGQKLVYDVYGEGRNVVVLLPGLLLSRKMQDPLAQALAEHGNRVISLDLLGHGESDRPVDMWRYSMPLFAEQVVGLLDHLDIRRAVVGGTSLGANVSLEAAMLAPARMQGLIVEMPVLDNALLACALAFTPLLVGLTFGAPISRAVGRVARRVPRGLHYMADVGLDWASQDPAPSAAVLQGLFFGRTAPPRHERKTIKSHALVIGHPRDPVHPFSDSDMLVRELPNARLVEASSILELRLTPERLTGEISAFVDECWNPKPRANYSARRTSTSRARRGSERTRRDDG
ncbi:MAG TPA: alpha/beta hydrolase [Thermoleophilaceae bacterium]|jgi:pimeloyl-ACP methyl ester carboxylesterase